MELNRRYTETLWSGPCPAKMDLSTRISPYRKSLQRLSLTLIVEHDLIVAFGGRQDLWQPKDFGDLR